MTLEDARELGAAIAEAAKIAQVPIENAYERRAICLKLAIDTRGLRPEQAVGAADAYLTFIEAAERP